jgi:HK97 family phage portal protein
MNFDLTRAIARQAEGKALGAHPAFMGRDPVATYSPGRPRTEALLSQREAAHHAQAYGGVEAIDWLYDCIGLYVDPVSTAPYALSKPDGTKLVRNKTETTPPEYEVGPKELYDLLDKPNPFMLYDELLSLLVIDLMLVGNAYWFKYNWGTPAAALYRLAPSHVKIKPGPYGPIGYQYQPTGAPKPLNIKPENITHFRRPNPHSQWYGMGVIQGAGRAMDLELAVTETMASYYENRADPSLIVQSERRVPRDVFNKLRAQLRARVSGAPNAGELLVLEAGLKASSLSTSASDALFDKLSKMSRDRVYTKFRCSPMLFGLMDEAAGSNKVSDARREFDNYALRPFHERVSRMITHSITDEWGVVFSVDHRQILPPEEAIKVGESVAKVPGVKVREVRKQYTQFGIEESTGDPEIDNLVINVPGEEMDEDGQGVDGGPGLADQPLAGEAGRPPLVKSTAAFGVAGAKVREGKALSVDEIEARLAELGAGKPEGKATPPIKGEQRPGDDFATARKADLDGLAAAVEEELRDAAVTLERGLLDHVEGKALKTSDLVSRIRNSDAWRTFKNRVTEILEDGARRAAASGVMHSGLAPEEDIDYDEVVENIVHRDDGVRSIVRTFRDRVVNRIKEAREANAERQEFEAAVREAVGDWSKSQAATVADTEMTHAYNEATLSVAELSGVENVYVTDGDDHDEPCKEANGQVWEISKARANRLEHPRCRRAFLPLTIEAVA